MSKLVASLEEVIKAVELRDGMSISFHHHLREGDSVLNAVMDAAARQGIKNLTICPSSLFNVHAPLLEHIKNGVVTGIACSTMPLALGKKIGEGVLEKPVLFHTHGARAADMESGRMHVDVAFIAAPAADVMGNCSGKYGPSACGSLGYAFADAQYAEKVVVVTDHLVHYPLSDFSIAETDVDYVVRVERIGDPAGIVSGTTRITRDPVGLIMAEYAAQVIEHSGLLKDGFSFQTGAGGASLAAARFLKEIMLRNKIQGSFAIGGITGYLVDMFQSGCFESLLDVQCFDLQAVESLRVNPKHREVTAAHYASPSARSAIVNSLDAVILGATQIDTAFNINVHTDSHGVIMGGSGGHSDTAAGAKLAMVIAPLVRARLSVIVEKVACMSTPGNTIDVLVTQYGIAVNPQRAELEARLADAGLPVKDIRELRRLALTMTGEPEMLPRGKRVVAEVWYRDGTLLDQIYQLAE